MANKDQQVGAKPHGRVLRQTSYLAAETIYAGDFVKLDSSGTISRAAATNALCGVAAHYATVGQSLNVYDHPQQLFSCQADDATIDAQTDINLNYNIIVGSPNTTYRRSGMQVDASTQNTTATLPVKVLKIDQEQGNALGSLVDVVIAINNHQLKGGTGTAGV